MITLSRTPYSNYSRFFPANQKVHLINMSQERARDQFDSLSGSIVAFSGDTIDVQVPYSTGQIIAADKIRNTTYKIITDSFGIGLQVAADLVSISADNHLRLRLISALEAFKRTAMPRIDSTIKVFHLREENTLSSCKSKFIQLVERQKKGFPFDFTLQEKTVNVSASGIRLVTESVEKSALLALCVLDLADGQSPVCAVAETTWQRRNGSNLFSGHRFITIFKSDQQRINRYVATLHRSLGIKFVAPRNNWALLDRMTLQNV